MSAPAPSAPATPQQVRSEDILSAKTDLCVSNALVKAGTGLAVGIVASAILFRRRPWPVFLGLGFGFGQGYSDCERVFNPAAVPGFKIQGAEAASPFKLSSQFASVVSPSQTSAVPHAPASLRPAPAAPAAPAAAAPSATPAKDAAASISHKVADAVAHAKDKASEVAEQAKETAEKAKEAVGIKVERAETKVKGEVEALKGDKKWV
ncbi:Mitochondrial inner membrane organizing system component [Rhodotorula kratochvilovae]